MSPGQSAQDRTGKRVDEPEEEEADGLAQGSPGDAGHHDGGDDDKGKGDDGDQRIVGDGGGEPTSEVVAEPAGQDYANPGANGGEGGADEPRPQAQIRTRRDDDDENAVQPVHRLSLLSTVQAPASPPGLYGPVQAPSNGEAPPASPSKSQLESGVTYAARGTRQRG